MEILLALTPLLLQISPMGYLGASFSDYRLACQAVGLQWNSATRKNEMTKPEGSSIRQLIAGLERAGMRVLASSPATARLVYGLTKPEDVNRWDNPLPCEAGLAKGLALYPYQRAGVSWLRGSQSCLLGDEMGLGKTIQVAMALNAKKGTILVVPASLKLQWAKELKKWRPELDVTVLSSRKNALSQGYPGAGEVWILNSAILPVSKKVPASSTYDAEILPCELLSPLNLVSDEAQEYKNFKAARTRRFRALSAANLAVGGSVWLMTGTPLLRSPMDLWGVLSAANLQWRVFGSWRRFLSGFGGRKGAYGGYEWSGATQPWVGQALARHMLRRERKLVMPSLPEKTWHDIHLSCKGKKSWENIAETLVGMAPEDPLPTFEKFSTVRREIAERKIPALLEQVENFEENRQKLVVFSAHKAPVEALRDRLGWAIITGDTSQKRRQEIVDAFQTSDSLKGIACTIQAAGVGLTLTNKCNHALFVDLARSYAQNAQAEDRICRIGQTRSSVVIHRLILDCALDRRCAELLQKKKDWHISAISAASKPEQISSVGGIELEVYQAKPQEETKQALASWQVKATNLPGKEQLSRTPNNRIHYSVALVNGEHRTFRLTLQSEQANFKPGRILVDLLTGPDNWTNYRSIGQVDDATINVWRKAHTKHGSSLMDALRVLAGDPEAAGLGYALRSSNCCICRKLLTVPASIHRGMGPSCAEKWS